MIQRTNHRYKMTLWLPKHTIAILHFVITGFLSVSSLFAEPLIHVDAQLCELPADTKLPEDLTQVAKLAKADSVSVPGVKIHSGNPTKISVSRNFEVAGKGSFPIGLFLTVQPKLDGEEFQYSVDFERSEFAGFADRSATQAPIFNIESFEQLAGEGVG